MLDFDEARERVLQAARPVGTERVPVWMARGRVLAEDIRAPRPWPPFDGSAMDGYAVRTADFVGAGPWKLPVSAHHRTGHETAPLEPGSVARIFTGAQLPEGADSVVMQENVERTGDEVSFTVAPKLGDNVRRRGEDLEPNQLALSAGMRLSGFQQGLIASLDFVEVRVARRPRVCILCTGDELRPPGGGHPGGWGPGGGLQGGSAPHTIADSNGVALSSLVEEAGCVAIRAPLVEDELEPMTRALAEALEGVDVVLTVGGVSVGDHDVVRPALRALGAEVDFWKVRMKPGKPLLLARRGAQTILGLPGNPASALVTFTLFGMPLLRRMQGDRAACPALRKARLAAPLRQKAGRRGFYRAVLEGDEVTPLANQASGAVTAMAWANALIVLPEETTELAAGSPVDVLALSDA